jgi:hypothetical protein
VLKANGGGAFAPVNSIVTLKSFACDRPLARKPPLPRDEEGLETVSQEGHLTDPSSCC